jgi:hypothetical protein
MSALSSQKIYHHPWRNNWYTLESWCNPSHNDDILNKSNIAQIWGGSQSGLLYTLSINQLSVRPCVRKARKKVLYDWDKITCLPRPWHYGMYLHLTNLHSQKKIICRHALTAWILSGQPWHIICISYIALNHVCQPTRWRAQWLVSAGLSNSLLWRLIGRLKENIQLFAWIGSTHCTG